jgi:uncharacterized protein
MIANNYSKSKEELTASHACRPGCAACCIAPSITSVIPGMAEGKPAGKRCVQLTDNSLCAIFNSPDRPAVCNGFSFDKIICGNNQQEAMLIMNQLENNCKV